MLNYEQFKTVIVESIKEEIIKMGYDMSITERQVYKNNCELDGVSFDIPGKNISPNLYINDWYNKYLDGADIDDISRHLVSEGYRLATETIDYYIPTKEEMSEELFFEVINYDANKEKLNDMPHRVVNDLAVVYRFSANNALNSKSIADGDCSAPVTNGLMSYYDFANEEELYRIAYSNTRQLYKPVAMPLVEVMREKFRQEGMPDDVIDSIMPSPADNLMWVVSNDKNIRGAVNMLYPDVLDDVCKNMNCKETYVIPSSVHECLVISADFGSPEELADLVYMVNQDAVRLEDRLSNEVYKYNSIYKTLDIASNSPNKSLDTVEKNDIQMDLYKDGYDFSR